MRRVLAAVLKSTAEVAQVASEAVKEAADVVQDVVKTVTEKKPTTA
jgi:hypothetical protein